MNPKIMPSFFDEPPLQCHEMLLWLDPLRLFAASFWVPAIYFLRLPFFFLMQVKNKSLNLEINTKIQQQWVSSTCLKCFWAKEQIGELLLCKNIRHSIRFLWDAV